MTGKRFLIVVVPSSGGRTIQFSVSKLLIYSAIALVVGAIALNSFFTYEFFAKSYQQQTVAELIDENDFLSSRLAYFGSEIDRLNKQYAFVVDKEKEIRTIFDLPEIDPQERALGIGGPVFQPEETPSYSRQLSYDIENHLDELVRLSSFETDQYDTIYSTLVQKKDQLDHLPSIMPTNGYVTRGFGVHSDPFTGIRRMHAGIDICNREGTPIYAAANGRIENIKKMGQLGITIILNHGNNLKTYYGHISKATIKVGQNVTRGDKIAELGNSGRSTGPHLHYAVKLNNKWVNPMDYILNRNWLAEN